MTDVKETESGLVVPLTDDGQARAAMTFGWAAGAELTEREQVLEELRQSNLTRIQDLGRQGVGLAPALTTQLLIDELVNAVCPDGSPERVEFFIRIEMRIAQLLEEAPAQAARARLSGAGSVPAAVPPAIAEAAARAAREQLLRR